MGCATMLRGKMMQVIISNLYFLCYFLNVYVMYMMKNFNLLSKSNNDFDFATFLNHRFQITQKSHWNKIRNLSHGGSA